MSDHEQLLADLLAEMEAARALIDRLDDGKTRDGYQVVSQVAFAALKVAVMSGAVVRSREALIAEAKP